MYSTTYFLENKKLENFEKAIEVSESTTISKRRSHLTGILRGRTIKELKKKMKFIRDLGGYPDCFYSPSGKLKS